MGTKNMCRSMKIGENYQRKDMIHILILFQYIIFHSKLHWSLLTIPKISFYSFGRALNCEERKAIKICVCWIVKNEMLLKLVYYDLWVKKNN